MISLNGDFSIHQPSSLKEGYNQVQTDKVSLKGGTRRIWMAKKNRIELTFSKLNSAEFTQIYNYIHNSGNPVTYFNSFSNLTIVGFATSDPSPFIPGASYLKDLTVTIVEE